MTSFLEELRSRMKAKQREWEKCREEVRKAKEKELRARDELAALQVLVDAEQPKAAKAPGKLAPIPLNDTATNKAEAVRRVLQECGSGLTPAEIREKLVEQHVDAGGNYLYSILIRGKKTGRLVEKGRRYYLADDKEKAAG